jgi:hypothetical protein
MYQKEDDQQHITTSPSSISIHENTHEDKMIFIRPTLSSMNKKILVSNVPRDSTTSNSTTAEPSSPTSSLSSSFRKPTKRQRHDSQSHDDESGPDTETRSVHFADLAQVHLVENASNFTDEERCGMYYTRSELERERRKSHQLARTMKFYTDHDLFDRFGVTSLRRSLQRYQEIQSVMDCVLEMTDERYRVEGFDIDMMYLQDKLQTITSRSAHMARQRAQTIAAEQSCCDKI